MPGKCSFQDRWIKEDSYKYWIRRDSDSKKARCIVCCISLNLASMGEAVLKAHMKSKRHERNEQRHRMETRVVIPDLFEAGGSSVQPSTSSAQAPSRPTCAQPSTFQSKLTDHSLANQALKAEILWSLKVVESHYSFVSSKGVGELFQQMFPDSDTALQFKCSETKCRYLTTFGLAPHFLNQLKERVRASSSGYALLFDESMNQKNKLKQMDFHVRFWDGDAVQTRYLTSDFLGHACAIDLFDKILSVQSEFSLPKEDMIQLGMDGPAVNWSVYNRIHSSMKEDLKVGLLHTGSCGLHTVHNSFRAGCNASSWQVDSFLSACYYLFKDSPARREDFMRVSNATSLPPKFCSHRWLENASVATKIIELLPALDLYVKTAEEKKIPLPKNKSFETVKLGVSAPLTSAQLAFFAAVAREMEPFLTKYQKDEPLIPYLSSDLQRMMRNLMRRFLRQDVLNDCDSAEKLAAVDVSNSDNYCSLGEIDIGFQARSLLQKAKMSKKNPASDRAVTEFQQSCRKFLKATVSKLQDKCPLKYAVIRQISCLNPETMKNRAACKEQMQNLLHAMCGVKRLDHETADTVCKEFADFLDDIASDAASFDPSTQRLDAWFYGHLATESKYAKLWNVIQKLLVLSHGQSTVERGFSYNKEMMTDNLSQKALKARRTVLDHIHSCGGILKVNITKRLLVDAGHAQQEYRRFLDEQSKLKTNQERLEKKRKKTEEIEALKKKRKTTQDIAVQLVEEADRLAFEGQQQRSFTLIDRSCQLRLASKDKKDEVSRLDKELAKLQEELKALP